jgi:hypothetical protein
MATFNEKLIANRAFITTRGADVTTSGTIADLANSGISFLRLTAATQLTSILGDVDGKELTIVNANTVPCILKNESGTAANRILTGTGGDASLAAGGSVLLKYDGAASRWRIISSLPHEGGRLVLFGYLDPNASCTYAATNATLNGFGSNVNCLGPVYAYNPLSIGSTLNTQTPTFNVQNVPIGVYEVSFNFCSQMNVADDTYFAIFDGSTTSVGNAASIMTTTATNNYTVTGVFTYTSPVVAGGFTIHVAASSGRTVTIFNDNIKRPITFKVIRYPL